MSRRILYDHIRALEGVENVDIKEVKISCSSVRSKYLDYFKPEKIEEKKTEEVKREHEQEG